MSEPPAALERSAAPEGAEARDPEWVRPVVAETVTWLLGSFAADATRNAYATHLGVPRAEQRWRPAPRGNRGRRSPGVLPQSLLAWCLTHDLDPRTDLDPDLLRAWIYHARACGDADATLRARLGAVLSWYQHLRAAGHTHLAPGDWLSRRDRANLHLGRTAPAAPTVPVTTAQVRALLTAAALDPTVHRTRNRALVSVLASTGLRAAELCSLDLDDVHPTGPDGTAPALRVSGKGGKQAWTRLGRAELELIETYLPERITPPTGDALTHPGQVSNSPGETALFTTAGGRRFSPGEITPLLRRLCRLPDPASPSQVVRRAARELAPLAETVHPHQFRHYYAHVAARNGYPATQIQKDLRHASLTTTQGYLDAGNDLSAAAAGFVSDLIHAGEDLTLLPATPTATDQHRKDG